MTQSCKKNPPIDPTGGNDVYCNMNPKFASSRFANPIVVQMNKKVDRHLSASLGNMAIGTIRMSLTNSEVHPTSSLCATYDS